MKIPILQILPKANRWVLVICCLLCAAPGFAQHKVSGIVSSVTDKEGLPGASVRVKGGTNGTTTDAKGAYTISAPNDAVLVFSFIGMITSEVPVNGKSKIDIVLEDDANKLEEVVVVDFGYGTVKKTDMTGSVATMSGRDLKNIPVANAAQAMTGRMPGVSVLTSDGSPDAEVVIRVRGGGSITQDNSPLYVVDGFIVKIANENLQKKK